MKRSIQNILVLTVGFILYAATFGLTPADAQFRYPRTNYHSLTDIGSSTIWSFANAVNNSAQVAGDMHKYSGSGQILRAFRTAGNQYISPSADDLGTLYGDYRSYAFAINNSGVVVGDSVLLGGVTRAVRSTPGTPLENLHPTTFTAAHSHARGISDYGWIVGYYKLANYRSRAMLTFGSGYTYSIDSWIGSPANLIESEAHDVNNRDQIVGWRSFQTSDWQSNYQPRAFLFDSAANVFRTIEIGVLPGGYWSKAYGVNDSGQVVGQGDTWVGSQGKTHAFLFRDVNNNGIKDPGEMQDLDTAGTSLSGALGINNNGVAVGYVGDSSLTGNSRAYMFVNGQMTDLNTLIAPGSGWILRVATGINDNGQIVGWMEDMNTDIQARVRHAFRIDPPPPIILKLQ